MMKAMWAARTPVEPLGLSRHQEAVRSDHIGFDERRRPANRSVNMAFCSEVNDRRNVMVAQHSLHQFGVADIAYDQPHLIESVQIGGVPRIGQGVEHEDFIVGMRASPMAYEVRADEAGPAGDQDASHGRGPSCSAF